MKTYVLMISKVFPSTHSKAGQPTHFKTKIEKKEKITTIRKNYDYWKNRIDNINAGNAVLSVRQWDGKPRQSTQTEVFRFGAGEVGIQKLEQSPDHSDCFKIDETHELNFEAYKFAENDALSTEDFKEWFNGFNTPEPYAIIHFSDFRY